MDPAVNWHFLTQALSYYQEKGYHYIEAPWIVPRHISEITCFSDDLDDFAVKDGDLVGSAEQSFLHLMEEGGLGQGKFCALTPCFRAEPKIDMYHRRYFMKLELINTLDTTEPDLYQMISTAQGLFEKLLNEPCDIEETDLGYDLCYHGIELGSYGVRKYREFLWLYGTGLAEPRLSAAAV